jgi:hypothetical protein
MAQIKNLIRPAALGIVVWLAGCASEPPATGPAGDGRALIDRSLPSGVTDRSGWVNDISAAFSELKISPSRENICAVIAVTQQESGFRVDPLIPNLGAIARREIDKRAEGVHAPLTLVHGVLELKSSNGQSYGDRIDHARTEKDLSDIYEDFTASVPLGRTLLSGWNPIRTRGPMQVNVAFAEQFSAANSYPYPVKVSIDDELFTRRGSLYFGTAHLLDYQAPYDRYLYRFADFNAGQYSSRNAAFQNALSRASAIPVDPDGALLPHGGSATPGGTERAARALVKGLNLSDDAIHEALELGRSADFERTVLYRRVFELADQRQGSALPRASLPRIKLQGPKITRNLTTEWYARRVVGRFQTCLNR